MVGGPGANLVGGQIIFDYSNKSSEQTTVNTVHSDLLNDTIRTSNPFDGKHALGWIDNGQGFSDGGAGENLNNVMVAYTLLGDANCDGRVNGTDLPSWRRIGERASTWGQGDFDDCYPLKRPPY